MTNLITVRQHLVEGARGQWTTWTTREDVAVRIARRDGTRGAGGWLLQVQGLFLGQERLRFATPDITLGEFEVLVDGPVLFCQSTWVEPL